MDVAPLSRQQVSDAVGPLGWCLVLGAVYTEVEVPSLARAAEVAAIAAASAGPDGQQRLTADVRGDRTVLMLTSPAGGQPTGVEVRLARTVTEALASHGLTTAVDLGDRPGLPQGVEIAIDALDIGTIRPFWQAVTGYVDEPGPFDPEIALLDPLGRGPTIWFQQMDVPRPQRNRIHLDIAVPHDVAEARVRAALAAGGTLLDDEAAPAFWVLADPEGNEACVCTWQGRD